MPKWLATVFKEWRLLARDWAGLLQLFAMPAVLVVVITLVQDSVLRQTAALKIYGILVDDDGGRAARMIIDELMVSDVLDFTAPHTENALDESLAREKVNSGEAQFYAVIAKGLSDKVEQAVRQRLERWSAGNEPALGEGASAQVRLYFDPTVSKIYRRTVEGDIRRATSVMQSRLILQNMGTTLENKVREQLGPMASEMPSDFMPPMDSRLMDRPLVATSAQSIGADRFTQLPTAVQQNVPAWALFGMFFIVVPLSGTLLAERRDGVFARLRTLPVSMGSLILGKLIAYVMVCLIQFICIAMVGKWLLPVFGTDSLVLDYHLGAIIAVAVISSLAATGYGIMLGALSRTNQQANVVGPLSIVIAAALGGIMVPVFAMPPVMQVISRLSPLAWAHEAFMVVMVRNGSLMDAWWQLALLTLFFLIDFIVASIFLRKF